MKTINLICPVSDKKANAAELRIMAFLTSLLIIAYLITYNPVFILLAGSDLFIRSIMKPEYSPFKCMASKIFNLFNFKKKTTDLAPKIFAARCGVFISILTLVFHFLGFTITSYTAAAIFLSLSLLNSLFGICVGCFIYTSLVFSFYQKREK
ncbi:MAG: DUF4395 domain-containing protein [Melioribacteraceae bacterium]|nr:DUF4395 domain-containing protein [Melioribacteraceae bacterium]